MPSNKRWCVEVTFSRRKMWIRRHLFTTRKAAEYFLWKYFGRYNYTFSEVKRVK